MTRDVRPAEKHVEAAIDDMLELLGRTRAGPARIDRFSQRRRTTCPKCRAKIRCVRCGIPPPMGTQQSGGIPDRRVVFVGAELRLWIEVKGRNGRLRKDQRAWLEDNIAAGELAAPAWSTADVRFMLLAAGFPRDLFRAPAAAEVSAGTRRYVETWGGC